MARASGRAGRVPAAGCRRWRRCRCPRAGRRPAPTPRPAARTARRAACPRRAGAHPARRNACPSPRVRTASRRTAAAPPRRATAPAVTVPCATAPAIRWAAAGNPRPPARGARRVRIPAHCGRRATAARPATGRRCRSRRWRCPAACSLRFLRMRAPRRNRRRLTPSPVAGACIAALEMRLPKPVCSGFCHRLPMAPRVPARDGGSKKNPAAAGFFRHGRVDHSAGVILEACAPFGPWVTS